MYPSLNCRIAPHTRFSKQNLLVSPEAAIKQHEEGVRSLEPTGTALYAAMVSRAAHVCPMPAVVGGSLLSSSVQSSKLLYHVFVGVKIMPTQPPGLSRGWRRTGFNLSVRSMGGWQEGTDQDICRDLQVEWNLGSQGDIQVLLNDKTIQFSHSQGEKDVLLNVKCVWEGQGVSLCPGDQHESSHSELHQRPPTCTLSLTQLK